MFLEAGQRLRLSTVGLIQYLTLTLQFLLAVVVYREPFTGVHLVVFGLHLAGAGAVQRRRLGQSSPHRERSVGDRVFESVA